MDSLRAGGCGSLSSLPSLGDRIIDSVSQTRPTDGCGDLGRGWEPGARARASVPRIRLREGWLGQRWQTTSQETPLHGGSGSITSGCPHGAELVTFPLKMVARKLILKHKGTISSHLQVLPKGQVRAIFRLLESNLPP